MALVLVGTDDLGVDRDVVCDNRVAGDAFLQSEIFWRIARPNRMDLSLELLSVAR